MRTSSQQTITDAGAHLPDLTEPSAERIAELRAAAAANAARGTPLYAHVSIRSAGELQWVFAENDWAGEEVAAGRARAQLEEADLRGINLAGMQLCQAVLRKADIDHGCLVGANLWRAELQGTRLERADLRHANLFGADLDRAWLWDADLRGTRLARTSLSATHFRGADLRGADLSETWMDSTTRLRAVKLDSRTCVAQIVWNSAPLIQVDWSQMPTVGEEAEIKGARSREERVQRILAAEQAYDGLAAVLQNQGVKVWASRYHLRALRLDRQAELLQGHVLSWFLSWLIDMLSGYGQYTARALRAYMLVVSAFTVLYFLLTTHLKTQSARLSWLEALVLSISSFHGRGFFPQSVGLGDPVAFAAAAEAVVGLFVELVFITTFSRRVLDR